MVWPARERRCWCVNRSTDDVWKKKFPLSTSFAGYEYSPGCVLPRMNALVQPSSARTFFFLSISQIFFLVFNGRRSVNAKLKANTLDSFIIDASINQTITPFMPFDTNGSGKKFTAGDKKESNSDLEDDDEQCHRSAIIRKPDVVVVAAAGCQIHSCESLS